MYYIFYQFKTGKVGYDEYLKESDVLAWVLKNGGHCLTYKIFEAVRAYKLGLIEEGKDRIRHNCSKCGGILGEANTSGYCQTCIASTRLERSERMCTECGKNRITAWNKSGLCTACRGLVGHKLINEKRKKQRLEKKEKKIKALEVEKSVAINQILTPSEKKFIDKDLPASTNTKGVCNKCKKTFKLESWQHSSLHWCPECRKSPEYKNFSKGA